MAGDQNTVDIEATLDTKKVQQGKTDIESMLAETKRMLEELESASDNVSDKLANSAGEGGATGAFLGGLSGVLTGELIRSTMELAETLNDIEAEWSQTNRHAAEIEAFGLTYIELSKSVDEASASFQKLSEWQQRTALGLDNDEMALSRYKEELNKAKKEIEELDKMGTASSFWMNLKAAATGGETYMEKQLAAAHKLAIAEGDMKTAVEEDRQKREDEFFESRNNAQRFRAEEDQRKAEERKQQADDKFLESFYQGFDMAGEQIAKAEAREFEKMLANNEKFASNRRSGHGLGESKEEFRSSVMTDALEVHRSLMTAGFSPHEQKMQAFEEKAAVQREQTNTIMSENLQNSRDVLQKLEKMDGGLVA